MWSSRTNWWQTNEQDCESKGYTPLRPKRTDTPLWPTFLLPPFVCWRKSAAEAAISLTFAPFRDACSLGVNHLPVRAEVCPDRWGLCLTPWHQPCGFSSTFNVKCWINSKCLSNHTLTRAKERKIWDEREREGSLRNSCNRYGNADPRWQKELISNILLLSFVVQQKSKRTCGRFDSTFLFRASLATTRTACKFNSSYLFSGIWYYKGRSSCGSEGHPLKSQSPSLSLSPHSTRVTWGHGFWLQFFWGISLCVFLLWSWEISLISASRYTAWYSAIPSLVYYPHLSLRVFYNVSKPQEHIKLLRGSFFIAVHCHIFLLYVCTCTFYMHVYVTHM